MDLKVLSPIKASINVPASLRLIADQIESGELNVPGDVGTLILNAEVFHIGRHISDERAAMQAVWDCTFAIAKLMRAATEEE